ncbi:MAG: NAD-dependent epimerase/dehydratase family protein [Betaproteobacteria bacterium]
MTAGALLVIGRRSWLAREFASRHGDLAPRVIGHDEVDQPEHYEGVTSVVNFAFHPALHEGPYQTALDIDARAARHAAGRGARYVMVSSRRVYTRAAQWNAAENADASGLDDYGRNKARVEAGLRDLLGARLTVLRAANVIGFEALPGRARFAAYLQNQLRAHGRIRLTVSPETRRDLVPVAFFSSVLRAVILDGRGGTYNVGAGRAPRIGDAAAWLIEGYGSGTVESGTAAVTDEFLLDSARLQRDLGLACAEGAVAETLREAGRRLAAGEAAG